MTSTNDYEFLNQITVTPITNLVVFPEKVDKECKQEIIIANSTDLQMTFKIICTSQDITFRPICGYIKPKDKAVVEVVADPRDNVKNRNTSFIVRWVIAGANCPIKAEEMWIANIVPNKCFQTVKIKVVFGETNNDDRPSERSTTEVSSYSESTL